MITIKIGGSVVDNLHPTTISDIKKIVEQEGVILVHGGGKEVTKVSKELGKEPKFVVSPGGINAIGLSGIDGKIIQAERKKKLLIINEKGRKQAIDGGYTGKITNVNASLLKLLLEQGYTPVISPIAISEEFDFLNVDGDRAAAYVAGKIQSDKVLFLTNVDGLLMDEKLVNSLTLDEAKAIIPKIGFGMEKKILAATEALDMGVKEALIANGQRENPISAAIAHDKCTVIQK